MALQLHPARNLPWACWARGGGGSGAACLASTSCLISHLIFKGTGWAQDKVGAASPERIQMGTYQRHEFHMAS